MVLSEEQAQAMLNETVAQARSERAMSEVEQTAQTWAERSDRWRLPVPETEADPALPGTHPSPLGAISWLFPAQGRDLLPERFWTLLDRLWGVLQAEEAPTRIRVESVTWPQTDPTHSPQVTFAEPELAWGAKLLAMMIEVRDEMARQPATPDLTAVDQTIARLQTQLEEMTPQP